MVRDTLQSRGPEHVIELRTVQTVCCNKLNVMDRILKNKIKAIQNRLFEISKFNFGKIRPVFRENN